MLKNLYYKGIIYDEMLREIEKIPSAAPTPKNLSFVAKVFDLLCRIISVLFPRTTTYVIVESHTIPSIHFECQRHIDSTQEIIKIAHQKAKEQGVINKECVYEIALCINKHFYDENLQEIRAYFINEKEILMPLDSVLGRKVIIGIDSFLLGSEIQKGFLYVSDYEEVLLIENGVVCSTLHTSKEELGQKIEILRDMYGDFDLHKICLRDEARILLEIALHQVRGYSVWRRVKQDIINEWESHKSALLNNQRLFALNYCGFFTQGKTHILRDSLVALCFCVCFIYPSAIFIQNTLLDSQLRALQSKDFNFDDLQSSATAQDNEIKELQNKNATLHKKLNFLAQNINTPLSVHISEIFSLLKTFDIALEHIVLAKSEEVSVINLHIHALNQAQIMHFLKALNATNKQAKVKQIVRKDDRAHSEVFVVSYE